MTPHRTIFLATFFFSLHLALVSYINSSALATFISGGAISACFAIASLLSLSLVEYAPHILRKVGLRRFAGASLMLSSCALLVLGFATHKLIFVPLFILYFTLNTSIIYAFDIFIEHYSKKGAIATERGLYLTLNNAAWVVALATVTIISTNFGFDSVYLLAALAMLPAVFLVTWGQKEFVDKAYTIIPFRTGLKTVWARPHIRRAIGLNFIMQFFFAWMVIYAPLYLTEYIGLSWKTTATMFTCMLVPFVLLQYPAGKIADRIRHGERTLLIFATMIGGCATIIFATLGKAPALYLGIALVCTRVGASIMEVICDSYFFKQVTEDDAESVSFYRTMTPLAYLIAPLLGVITLSFTTLQGLFMILGTIMLCGTILSIRLDTTPSQG